MSVCVFAYREVPWGEGEVERSSRGVCMLARILESYPVLSIEGEGVGKLGKGDVTLEKRGTRLGMVG